MTRWGQDVTPDSVLPEYPRPQLQRSAWLNLNGLWDYAITPLDVIEPTVYDGEILVPFCVQSSLSGVRKLLQTEEVRKHALWYHRTFDLPISWANQQVLLHFGAVDWEARIWINGRLMGTHRGGYDPFALNITRALLNGQPQKITIRVTDPVGQSMGESIGKQTDQPEYDGVTGIWQTVWLEPVPDVSIDRLELTPDIDRDELHLKPTFRGNADDYTLDIQALDAGRTVARASGPALNMFTLKLTDPKLWHPDHPFLYDLKVKLLRHGSIVDEINSYFGMRKISIGKVGTVNRILLNNQPLFMIGPLDQGIWPESVLTPPSEEALRYDLQFLKDIQCNMVRLHINGKPERWYYACDQLGLLVWQDFICGPKGKHDYSDTERNQWMREQQGLVKALYNHPSVVMWMVFNENWGQHQAPEYSQWAGRLDPTRLITLASGFNDVPGLGHIRDMHIYINTPAIAVPEYEPERAVVLGEWGGFVSAPEGHNWSERRPGALTDDEWIKSVNWPKYSMGPALLAHYTDVIEQLHYLKELGLSGAVYTQLADMKKEQNGYLSMDRKVIKMQPAALRRLHERLIHETVETSPIIEASIITPQPWQYFLQAPTGDWTAPDYNDSHWSRGEGPFGHTPGFILPKVNTPWQTDNLYLRKSFKLDSIPERICLRTYVYGQFGVHNTCDIYLNGHKVKELYRWHKMAEELQVLTLSLRSEARAHLRRGQNHIAVQVKLPVPINNKLYDIGIYYDKNGKQLQASNKEPQHSQGYSETKEAHRQRHLQELSYANQGLPTLADRLTAVKNHDRAIQVLDVWIRDPFIFIGEDDTYYLTGTTIDTEPDGVIGIPLWRSKNLAQWEKLPRLWSVSHSSWMGAVKPKKHANPKLLVWAPEIYHFNDRWIMIHTTNANTANLLVSKGSRLRDGFNEPMQSNFGAKHDPFLYTENGKPWLVWGCTNIAPMKTDFTGFVDKPVQVGPSNRKMGHEGSCIMKVDSKYILFGTAWSTDHMRKGTYNLYYCVSDSLTGPYGPRRFAGRFLGHGTPFKDIEGRWWCTAFFNANHPQATLDKTMQPEVAADAYTINPMGVTLVPLDIKVSTQRQVTIRAKDPAYAQPGPEEKQTFTD